MAFYHTYRPANFEDMSVTQPEVAEYFGKAIKKESLAHVYLFVGSHGIGKTSAARILARAVNCKSDKGNKPCNACENCTDNIKGSFADLYELDAASNRGIDDVRQLQEIIRLSPMQGLKKVYIIDEVHMLTTEAFNALLKTFEEPPAARLFILCTTELQKVPLTIQSRATVVHFQKPNQERLEYYLQKIADAEGLKLELEARAMLAQFAQGAYRDAAKLLEQVSSNEKKISAELVKQILRGTTREELEVFLRAILMGDMGVALDFVVKFESGGVNASHFVHNLVHEVRGLVKRFVLKQELPEYASGLVLTGGQLVGLLDNCQKCMREVKLSPIPFLPVEILVYEMMGFETFRKVPERKDVESKEVKVVQQKAKEVHVEKVQTIETVASLGAAVVLAEEVLMPVADAVPKTAPAESPVLENILQRWREIVVLVKDSNASVSSVLRTAKPQALEGKTLYLSIAYRFHKERLEAAKNRVLVESALYDLFGVQLRVSCVLEQSKVTKKDIENVKEVQDEGLVEAAMEIFGQ